MSARTAMTTALLAWVGLSESACSLARSDVDSTGRPVGRAPAAGAAGASDAGGDAEDAGATGDGQSDPGADAGDAEDEGSGAGAVPVLNEVAAHGDPNDRFELLNRGPTAIDLSAYTFTDDLADPTKTTFEAGTTIQPGEYLVSELTDTWPGFALGSDEELGVYAPDRTPVGELDWNDGDSPAGGSLARIPDATGDFQTVSPATPGAPND